MENMLHTTPTLSHEINNYLTIIYSQLQHIEHLYKYLSKDEHWIRMKEDFSSAFRLLQELMEEENLVMEPAAFRTGNPAVNPNRSRTRGTSGQYTTIRAHFS